MTLANTHRSNTNLAKHRQNEILYNLIILQIKLFQLFTYLHQINLLIYLHQISNYIQIVKTVKIVKIVKMTYLQGKTHPKKNEDAPNQLHTETYLINLFIQLFTLFTMTSLQAVSYTHLTLPTTPYV